MMMRLVLATFLGAVLADDCSSSTTTLSNGVVLPRVGLGTAGRMKSDVVAIAIESGVRLFDTAQATEWYDEEAVAAALKASGLRREEYSVVTKLHPRDHGEQRAALRIAESAQRFGGYIDGFLQHYPKCWPALCGAGKQEGDFRDSWRAMEAAYADGTVKAIGISNFDVDDLEILLLTAKVKPHLAQGWMDPFHQDAEMRAACKKHGISYMSYSTLGTQWSGRNRVLTDPTIASYGEPAAVTLSWALQRGAIVIPRSFQRTHIAKNAALFSGGRLKLCLSEAQLLEIDDLQRKDREVQQQVDVTFISNVDAILYWVEDHTERRVATIKKSLTIKSYHGHTFVARTQVGALILIQESRVTASPGSRQTIEINHRSYQVEEDEEEL